MQEPSFTAELRQHQPEITVDKLVFSKSLEGVGISAHPTAQGELLPRWWVNHMQRALSTLQLLAFGPCRTMRQLLLRDTGHPLEVIMAGVTEVCGAKAEENSHRAAVPAFILQEVCAVLGTHLSPGDI